MTDTLTTISLLEIAEQFAPDIVETQVREAATFSILPYRTPLNGNAINWVVESDAALGENVAEGADASNFATDTQINATLGFGRFRSNFHVSDEAIASVNLAQNPWVGVSLLARSVINAAAKVGKMQNTQTLGGTTSNGHVGFDTAIDSAGTYAGIDPSSDTYWVSWEQGTTAVLSKKLISQDLAEIKNLCGERPDIAIVNPILFSALCSLFDSNREYSTSLVQMAQSAYLGEASVPVVQVAGCTFVEDSDGYYSSQSTPGGTILYLNTNYVYKTAVPYGGAGVTVPGTYVPMQLVELAKAGSSTKGMVRCMSQVVVEKRSACGKRQWVTVPT